MARPETVVNVEAVSGGPAETPASYSRRSWRARSRSSDIVSSGRTRQVRRDARRFDSNAARERAPASAAAALPIPHVPHLESGQHRRDNARNEPPSENHLDHQNYH